MSNSNLDEYSTLCPKDQVLYRAYTFIGTNSKRVVNGELRCGNLFEFLEEKQKEVGFNIIRCGKEDCSDQLKGIMPGGESGAGVDSIAKYDDSRLVKVIKEICTIAIQLDGVVEDEDPVWPALIKVYDALTVQI